MKQPFLLLFLLTFWGKSLCSSTTSTTNTYVIRSAQELSSFSDDVNGGESYKGTTVLLENDIYFDTTLSIHFNPIGVYKTGFQGTFDGQGYAIKNLTIEGTSFFTGLFGRSSGMTLKNLVLDSTCTVTGSFRSMFSSYVGGFIGYCEAVNRQCNIENCVNMAKVAFAGYLTSYESESRVGGLIGSGKTTTEHTLTVRNCANYGAVTDLGSSGTSNIGGIVGHCYGMTTKNCTIQNSVNYGTLEFAGDTSFLYIGGIAGITYFNTVFENCVFDGTFKSKRGGYFGNVVGGMYSTTVANCYWSDTAGYKAYGFISTSYVFDSSKFSRNTFELSEEVSAKNYTGKSLITALNTVANFYALRDYSHWLLNKDKHAISFTVNERDGTLSQSQIVLLPGLTSDGKTWFDGWYTDKACTQPLKAYEVTSDTSLYGKWEENFNNYTITFDTRGGSPVPDPIVAQFGTVVKLPMDVSKEKCVIGFWDDDQNEEVSWNFSIPGRNVTLHAVWVCNHIETAEDFIAFAKVVNSGTSFKGTTVLLDADIDFGAYLSREFNPVGRDETSGFLGVFDGQGHVISNLVVDSPLAQYVGLFGNSDGMSIRNVVMDTSCAMVNSYTSPPYTFAAGLIGFCHGLNASCTIENVVNMASVTFTGNISYAYVRVGGIAGELYAETYSVSVRNCANYGSVINTGASGTTFIGGLVGYIDGPLVDGMGTIQNSHNYGAITHTGVTKTKFLNIGGIVGWIEHMNIIENCLSGGLISANQTTKNIGVIAGYAFGKNNTIAACHWTVDAGAHAVIGDRDKGSEVSVKDTYEVLLNTTTLEYFNSLAKGRGWSKWLMLHLNGGKINGLDQESLIATGRHFPEPEAEGQTFKYWCTDVECRKKYDPMTANITEITDLYVMWEDSESSSSHSSHSSFVSLSESSWEKKSGKRLSASSIVAISLCAFFTLVIVIILIITYLSKKDHKNNESPSAKKVTEKSPLINEP